MSQARTSQRTIFWWVVIGVSVALWVLVIGLFAVGTFYPLEADIYDGRFKLRGTRPDINPAPVSVRRCGRVQR